MKRVLLIVLFVFASCEKTLDDPHSGDTCPHSVVCEAQGYDFTFGDGYGTAYLCTVEASGALYLPQALNAPCVSDGDPCGDGTEQCYVPQACLTPCTLGEIQCSGSFALYECIEDDLCDSPYFATAEPGTPCE